MEKRVMNLLCDHCGSNFTDASNLRRHLLTAHADEGTHMCPICDKMFARSDYLKKHVKQVHNMDKENDAPKERNFKCQLCEKAYALRKGLDAHMKKQHGGQVEREVEQDEREGGQDNREAVKFKCDICSSTFGERKNLNKHMKKFHSERGENEVQDDNLVGNKLVCPECDHAGVGFKGLVTHMEEEHRYVRDTRSYTFKCMSDFKIWKETEEARQLSSYVNRRGTRDVVGGKKLYLECHRGGFYEEKGKGIRYRKQETRTKKIDAVCPSRMVVMVKEDSEEVVVEWDRKHFGHEVDIQFLYLSELTRKEVADDIKAGKSFDRILDEIRDSVEDGSHLTRKHILTMRDLWNIQKTVEFKVTHAHQDDRLSVDILIRKLQEKGDKSPVVFYKQQHTACNCGDDQCPLSESDFMLILSTPFQREHIAPLTREKVLIDSTHGTNDYDFQLTILGTVDSAGVGVPVAYCISTRVSEEHMSKFFRLLKEANILTSNTQVFMSDMAAEFYNAWRSVFGVVLIVLFCSWHVDKRWRAKTKEKVKTLQKQAEVYRAMITLRNILDEEWFEICVHGMRDMLKADEDTKPFIEYFEGYVKNKKKWAYCFRTGAGLNTNMFMESMFKKLKYSYMKGKKLRRVDECLNILLKFTRNLAFERLIRMCKGNDSYRFDMIVRSHKRSASVDIEILREMVEEKETGKVWEVKSFRWVTCRDIETKYTVELNTVGVCVDCQLVCSKCHFCFHEYRCSCPDYLIKSNMCKHIHAVALACLIVGMPTNERRLVERAQECVETIVETDGNWCEVGRDVQVQDMWQPVAINIRSLMDEYSRAAHVPDAVVNAGLKFLEVLRKEMQQQPEPDLAEPEQQQESEPAEPEPESEQEPQPEIIFQLPHVSFLTAQSPSHNRTPSHTSPYPQTPSRTPALGFTSYSTSPSSALFTPSLRRNPGSGSTKKVSPQRRLLSFRSVKKRPMKKKLNFAKPTQHQQGSYIASFILGPQAEVMNIQSTDTDHDYSMDTDDTY